ncbi:MAG: hypothetical protein U0L85_10105 [Bacilli bacterium]|nr:hypothetical protein [Bacilli bacterium]
MKKNRKGSRFERFAKKFLIVSFVLFAVGVVALNSYESTLNVNCLKVEKEISAIQSEIDSLDMKKQELVSFSRISSIATSKGYNYRQSSVAANIVGVNVNE